MNKKIAVVGGGHIPSKRAHSVNTVKHAQGFKILKNEVTIFSPLRYREDEIIKKTDSINEFYGIDKDIPIKLFKDKSPFYFDELFPLNKFFALMNILTTNKVRYFIDPEKTIAEYVKKHNFDFAYCRSYRTPYYLIKVDVPSVVESHVQKIGSPELKLLLKYSKSESFKCLSTASELAKKVFIKAGVPIEKILVQENAVDVERYDKITDNKKKLRHMLKLPPNKIIITYLGSIEQSKGIDDILFCAEKNKNLIFQIIGGNFGDDFKYYKNFLKKIKYMDNIIYQGHITNSKVPSYLKSSDLLLAPYNELDHTNHGSPIKLFEYMATKVPIIISDIPRMKKIVTEEEVTFFKANDVFSLEDNIIRFLSESNDFLKKSNEAYLKAQTYTYEKRCKKIIDFINI